MVDLHTHILPGIDDGSKNIAQTMELFKEAKQAGFNKIVLTSHYMENLCTVNEQEREKIKNIIETKLGINQMGIELYLGSEIYYSTDMVNEIKNNNASTINKTRYVLFELPMNTEILDIYEIIYSMQSNRLIPILAHPERYICVQKNVNMVGELVEKGVLMQSNYGSILGVYGKEPQKVIKYLLKNNLIHFLGSDVHMPKTIYPKIEKAIKKIEKIIGKEKFKELSTINPNKVLNNQDIV